MPMKRSPRQPAARRHSRFAGVSLLVAGALLVGGPAGASARLAPVIGGLERPVAIEHAGDARLYIVEQPGRIRVLNPDRTLRTLPLLDITDRVYDVNNEQGLLGLAFDPDFATNRRFYVNYIFHP